MYVCACVYVCVCDCMYVCAYQVKVVHEGLLHHKTVQPALRAVYEVKVPLCG
jgi:hypothetical protein